MAVVDSKRCTSCGIEKSLTDFRKSKFGMLGRDAECKSCRGAYDKSRANLRRERRKEQGRGDRTSEYAKRKGMTAREYIDWRKRNESKRRAIRIAKEKEKILKIEQSEKRKAWREKSPMCYWIGIGRPWSKPGLSDADRFSLRYKYDKKFRIMQCIKTQVRKHMRGECAKTEARIYAALSNNCASPTTESFLGYSIDELKSHLEKQFRRGMTWGNYGKRWHIDHIMPKSKFNPCDPDEVRACWALTNLRPLDAKKNLEKRDKVLFLL